MRTSLFVLIVLFCSCRQPPVEAQHQNKPLTDAQVDADIAQAHKLATIPEGGRTERLYKEGMTRFKGKPFKIGSGGTDSIAVGIDGWRSCAKLDLKKFGFPQDAFFLVYDQNGKDCGDDPNTYTVGFLFAAPEIAAGTYSQTYKDEKVKVDIVIAATISP